MTAPPYEDTWPEPLVKAQAMLRQGRPTDALKLLRVRLAQFPGDPRAMLLAARASIIIGQNAEAEAWLDSTAGSGAWSGAGWVQIGLAYAELRRFGKAVACFQRATDLEPDCLRPLILLARARLDQGLPEAARSALERARAMEPHDPEVATVMAVLLEKSGQLNQAVEVLEAHAESPAASLETLLLWSRICRGLERNVDLLRTLESFLGAPITNRQKASVLFELAAWRERSGDYEGAFRDASRANVAIGSTFNVDAFESLVEAVLETGLGEYQKVSDRPLSSCHDPIFIVGVPRSGTTLVEQILSMHPHILAVGEHSRLERAARNWSAVTGVSFPFCLNRNVPGFMHALREAYLEPLSQVPDEIRWITDKMPTNFLRLGLAARLFPGARVIRCAREPLDTGVSCFFQEFGGVDTEFANDLQHIGRFLRAEARLMDNWCDVLPLPILEFRYEELVADPVAAIRRLLSFLELEWTEDLLRFDKSQRYVTTPSSSQVRQPIYATSVGRHRHYLSYLGPLRKALDQ